MMEAAGGSGSRRLPSWARAGLLAAAGIVLLWLLFPWAAESPRLIRNWIPSGWYARNLTSADSAARRRASFVLEERAFRQDVSPYLLGSLHDPDVHVRINAARGVLRSRMLYGEAAVTDEELVRQFGQMLRTDPSPRVKKEVYNLLSWFARKRVAAPEAGAALDVELRDARRTDWYMRASQNPE